MILIVLTNVNYIAYEKKINIIIIYFTRLMKHLYHFIRSSVMFHSFGKLVETLCKAK